MSCLKFLIINSENLPVRKKSMTNMFREPIFKVIKKFGVVVVASEPSNAFVLDY